MIKKKNWQKRTSWHYCIAFFFFTFFLFLYILDLKIKKIHSWQNSIVCPVLNRECILRSWSTHEKILLIKTIHTSIYFFSKQRCPLNSINLNVNNSFYTFLHLHNRIKKCLRVCFHFSYYYSELKMFSHLWLPCL